MDGSASPRNPSVEIARDRRVSQFAGGVAFEGEQRVVPQHAAAIVSDANEPAAAALDSMRMSVAPASREFSRSSLTTEAGRSTTSPAAILLATWSERIRMRPI